MASQKLAIFDVDGTLIHGQSQQAFIYFLFRKGFVGLIYYVKIMFWFFLYKLGGVKDPKPIMEYAIAALGGMTEEELEKIINEFYEKDLKRKFYKEGIEIIRQLRTAGNKILLVSNAITPLVKRISLPIGADDFIGTDLEIIGGKMSGKINGPIMYGEAKRVAVINYAKHYFYSLSETSAYGDHLSDLPVLELVGHPHIVNPSGRLREIAEKRHWPILNLKITE